MIGDARAAVALILLDIDDELRRIEAHPAMLARPGRRDPALGGQLAEPVGDFRIGQPVLRKALLRRILGLDPAPALQGTEERSEGNEWVSPGKYRWVAVYY